jgi:hypothetical protein
MMKYFLTLLCTVSFTANALTLDERPAEADTWGYRPSAESKVTLNPPGFTWRPTKGADAYVLEVASDAAFANPVYRGEDLPWSAHCPNVTFPAGTYHWRYAAVATEGVQTAWSTVRSFTIGPEAVAFPKPSIDEATARLPKWHPRLFFRNEDLARYRELADGDLAEVYAGLIASADKLLVSPPDVTEPPLYPEGTVRLSAAWKKIWWGNRRRTIAVVNSAATLAFTYRMTGDEKYGQGARDLLMAFAAWDPNGSTQYEYNDEAAMPALYFASRAYSWAYPMLSEADRARMVEVMTVRGRDCYNHLRKRPHLWRPYASHSNRAWHFLGELSITFMDDIPEARSWLDYAMTIFYTCYPVWTGGDGAWHEGVAYWSSYINRFMYWAFVMDSSFGVNVFERPFFQRSGDYGMYLMPPGSNSGGFGDQAQHSSSKGIAPLMAVLAAGASNGHWKWFADTHGVDGGSGYLGMIYGARLGATTSTPPSDLPSSAVFPETGLAMLNTNLLDGTDNVQVLFKSSPMGRVSHGHNSNNAFLLNVNGHTLLRRAGRREVHGSPHHREYMWHTKSDNAILVNGEGQIPHSAEAKGRITSSYFSDNVDVLVGEAGDSYTNLNRWTRRVIFLKPSVVVLHDVLEAPEPSQYQFTLHGDAPFEIGNGNATLQNDHGRVRVQFVEPAGLALTQTDFHDPPLAEWNTFNLKEWHLQAEVRNPAKQQSFLTYLVVGDAEVTERSSAAAGEGLSQLNLTIDGEPAHVEMDAERFSVRWREEEKSFGEAGKEANDHFLVSAEGCGRATGYAEANKIVTLGERTHIAWLDSPEEGFRVRLRTLNRSTGEWSPVHTLDEAYDNHGGPALTADSEGFLHIAYYPHHHAMRYRRSLRPNDITAWTEAEEIGVTASYPTLVCGPDDTLYLTCRESSKTSKWVSNLYTKQKGGAWSGPRAILQADAMNYAHFMEALAWGADHKTLHLATRMYGGSPGRGHTIGYLRSSDFGETWTKWNGTPVALPIDSTTIDVVHQEREGEGVGLRAGSLAIAPNGKPYIVCSVMDTLPATAWLAYPGDDGTWRQRDVRAELPEAFADWSIATPGGLTFSENGTLYVVLTMMKPEDTESKSMWGNPTSEVLLLTSEDLGESFSATVLTDPDPATPRWLPSMERSTGFNRVTGAPGLMYTEGTRGEKNSELVSNNVRWVDLTKPNP